MTFIWPTMLFSLLTIPLFIGFYLHLQRRRERIAANFNSFLVNPLRGNRSPGAPGKDRKPGIRRHIPPIFFLVSLALLLLALGRPQMTVSLPRVEGTVILAFDVSGSMAADDLHPNRLAAAKESAREFVQRQPSNVQIGVVAFSEGGIPVQVPTNDQEAVLASINRLEPQRGTSLGHGILTSLHAIFGEDDETFDGDADYLPPPLPNGTFGPAIIVLLTDGENTAPPDPFEAAYVAAEHGIRIYSIGIGSPAGAILNIDGFTVHTQLNETALQQIAGLTGGEYYNAATEEELREIYNNISPELVIRSENMEVTSIFAGASILILLIGGGLMLLWFGRLP
jgi:Ca-activated chloride channel homolog